MLSDDVKTTIQKAYSELLRNKSLKPRLGQRVMIAEIAKTLGGVEVNDDGEREGDAPICVVEAGTGTGKTIAYTLAVLPIAKALGKKVVLATATVALQEQIVLRDLPDILKHSGLNFSSVLAKGRGRYVCISKLDQWLASGSQQQSGFEFLADEGGSASQRAVALPVYQSMLEGLAAGSWDGDRDNWEAELTEDLWYPLTTDRNQCTSRRCAFISQCSFFKARENLLNADCIVTNHDLVLADLALGGGAILPPPDETIYVFDEAHHLPERALNHFSYSARHFGTLRTLEQMAKQSAEMANMLFKMPAAMRELEQMPSIVEEVKRYLALAQPQLEAITSQVLAQPREGEELPYYRFENGVVPDALRDLAIEITARFANALEVIERAHKVFSEALDDVDKPLPQTDLEAFFALVGQWRARLDAYWQLWTHYAHRDEASRMPKARWVRLVDAGGLIDYELHCSPILGAEQLRSHLWSRCFAAVLTSATLTALGKFDRFRQRSGVAFESNFQVVPSPFDYANAALLRVPKMSGDPSDPKRHTEAIIEVLPGILREQEGTLVLFASRKQMRDVYFALPDEWRRRVLMQGDKSKHELLKAHKSVIESGATSVIFGLASFSEGVDLPGKLCTHVIIAKIPFAVPDDPIESALAEWITARGGNPFMEIAVPDAALKLVQASGRLIRTESDRGTISLLDRRIVEKRYGRALLDSLPPFRREIA